MVPNSERFQATETRTERVKGSSSNWEDFDAVATRIFSVWVDGQEHAWAQRAWSKLAEKGLTGYSTEFERTQVCVRLMSLGAIYMDFCYHAWEENCVPDFSGWGKHLEIQPFQMGRLVQTRSTSDWIELEPFADECGFLEQAYLKLTDSERPKIHTALCNRSGDFVMLYLDLHQSRVVTSEDTEADACDVTAGNSVAFDFVQNRFARVRDYDCF